MIELSRLPLTKQVRYADEQENSHNQVQREQCDLFQRCTRSDVTSTETSGQNEVDLGKR